jgi:hypothetical protein
MNKKGSRFDKTSLEKKLKAQSTIEFSLAFVVSLLFLILTCNLFVWLNHNVVARQMAYEGSRVSSGTAAQRGSWTSYNSTTNTTTYGHSIAGNGGLGNTSFYAPKVMNLTKPGGIN